MAFSRLSPLLFLSGLCALIYQVTWQRDLRLVFGASTAASAAVIAVFIAGLGAGSIVLGRRAERRVRPVLMYAHLEALIATFAAATPALLWLSRELYVAAGGTLTLGPVGGTVLRLVLAALVLGVPTFLMGGTLPAAARGVTQDDDPSRRQVALLYGVNTLGAVVGAVLATFVLLEVFGNRRTLWMACCLNVLVAVAARALGRRLPLAPAPLAAPTATSPAAAPPPVVLAAAATVGFAFFLMELVWYRMLGPLLGGTVFTFGLILAVALFGIGIGGALYAAIFARRPATLRAFAFTCLLEALGLAIPFALGDRLAVLAVLLRPLGGAGFVGFVGGWVLVAAITVLPAALAAGVQFPLLIALLGQGRQAVGRQVGQTYAWNTVGAIAGALAGGFGLLPWLSAPGCWRLCGALLGAVGLAAIVLSAVREQRWWRLLPPVTVAVLVVLLLATAGPTAAWRHSNIGVGRVDVSEVANPLRARDFVSGRRRQVVWEADGIESSVAVGKDSGLAFILNGKVDGNARHDAATQVMAPLVGAILHPRPRRALVIGLGTGSSAGWLAADPRLEAVDVVELEPLIVKVAEACTAVNHEALRNPRLHLIFGDARETLLVTSHRYDLIVSEPSNPYRAGIASLFTREYYLAAAERLAPGGKFLQWVQGYEVDAQTIRTIYATLASVFPQVESWHLRENDMLLVASVDAQPYDAAELRARIRTEPFKSALANAWRVDDLEGFFGHYLARPSLARRVAAAEGDYLNTDDHTLIEFGFARALGAPTDFGLGAVLAAARAAGEDRPLIRGDLDLSRLEDHRADIALESEAAPALGGAADAAQRHRLEAKRRAATGDLKGVLREWQAQPRAPTSLFEITIVAEAYADRGDERAADLAARLRPVSPVEADVIIARLRLRQQRLDDAMAAFAAAFTRYRTDPWPWPLTMRRALNLVEAAGHAHPELAGRLFDLLRQPFAVYANNAVRQRVMLALASAVPPGEPCVTALAPFEPHLHWTHKFLQFRANCYRFTDHPMARQAEADLQELQKMLPQPFDQGLEPPTADPVQR